MTKYKAHDTLLIETSSGFGAELDLLIEYTVTDYYPQTQTNPEEPRMVEDVEMTALLNGVPVTLSSRIESLITNDNSFRSWLMQEAREDDAIAADMAADAKLDAARDDWERWL